MLQISRMTQCSENQPHFLTIDHKINCFISPNCKRLSDNPPADGTLSGSLP